MNKSILDNTEIQVGDIVDVISNNDKSHKHIGEVCSCDKNFIIIRCDVYNVGKFVKTQFLTTTKSTKDGFYSIGAYVCLERRNYHIVVQLREKPWRKPKPVPIHFYGTLLEAKDKAQTLLSEQDGAGWKVNVITNNSVIYCTYN